MNNMKVGILNFQYSDHNYGAVIQACALHYFIKSDLNLDVLHINLIPGKERKNIYQKLKKKVGYIFRQVGIKKGLIQHEFFKNPGVFEDFRREHLPRTKVLDKASLDEICNELSFTHIVVGSDQVWRPQYTRDLAEQYFLSFVPDSVKKISYAASFGQCEWLEPEIWTDTVRLKELLKRFDYISVREKSGVSICDSIFGVEAQHVLDPTLLVDDKFYYNIVNNIEDTGTAEIVYYKLDLDNEFIQLVLQLESSFGYTSENIYYNKIRFSYYYNSVPQWLCKIKNSKLVVTDSFHCLCFALIFKKDFIYYPNEGRGLTRVLSLLGELGLLDRIYKPDSNYLRRVKPIDYSCVDVKLGELRQISSNFIKKALG